MAGRRVAPKRRNKNPLYVLFMLLLILTIVLAVTVGVLSLKLRAANRELAHYQSAQTVETAQQEKADEPDAGQLPNDDIPAVEAEPAQQVQEPGAQQTENAPTDKVIDWLDLTGHDEVEVVPTTVFKEYFTYYTTGGVNLRSGPATSYAKVKLLSSGTEVRAAAKQDGWTFVSADGKFGWIKSDYLGLEKPAPEEPAPQVSAEPTQTPAENAEASVLSEEPTQTESAAPTE